MSFLTNSSQKIKIGDALSGLKTLNSGIPQGGILSTLIYIIFVADFGDWLIHSLATTYADDTSTTVSGDIILEVMKKLEEDSDMVLRFMALKDWWRTPRKPPFFCLTPKN